MSGKNEQKNDNKLLITIIIVVVVVTFILPLVAGGLITFGVFRLIDRHMGDISSVAESGLGFVQDEIESSREYRNSKGSSSDWKRAYAMAVAIDEASESEAGHPISYNQCAKVEDIADKRLDEYNPVCEEGAELNAEVTKTDDGDYKGLTFGNEKYCTRISLDLDGDIRGVSQYGIIEGESCGSAILNVGAKAE